MTSTKSAVRYAKALLELSLEQGVLSEVARDFAAFSKITSESSELRSFLDSPVIRADKKNEILQTIFPEFTNLTTQFMALVVKNGRESLLPEMAKQFDRLLKKHQGIVTGTLTSSVALDDATKKQILEKVSGKFEGKLELSYHVDSSLIGGFVVRVEDQQLDLSVLSQLNALKQELVKP